MPVRNPNVHYRTNKSLPQYPLIQSTPSRLISSVILSFAISLPKFCMQVSLPQCVQYFLSHITLFYLGVLIIIRPLTECLESCCQGQSDHSPHITGKVHPCTGTEALYRPYGPLGE